MANQFKRVLILSLALFLMMQCAWFSKNDGDDTLVKPVPVGGYAELQSRINYPKTIREQNIEGSIVVSAHISETGDVLEVSISQSLFPDLDQIASNAVKRTPFIPATRNGEPVSVWISIPFVFALKEWQDRQTPMTDFEMVIFPDPAYRSFRVEMHGKLKSGLEDQLRVECLLPFNYEKAWSKNGSGIDLQHWIARDDLGEWLTFKANGTDVHFGFEYRPIFQQANAKFQYGFTLNHKLPQWVLAVSYNDQSLVFEQEPDRIISGGEGARRYEYDLHALDAYEMRFLEIGIEN